MLRNFLHNKQLFSTKSSLLVSFYTNSFKYFTGKTETGHKFTTPKLRMKSVKPIFPPPGDNLQIPGTRW